MSRTRPSDRTVAVIWRHGRELLDVSGDSCATVRQLFRSLRDHELEVAELPFREEDAAASESGLMATRAALVWVNPVQDGRDRRELDRLLRRAADAGTWVSAHPDLVDQLGTKEVLVRARIERWDADARAYRTPDELRREFPIRLAGGSPRVLKQNRGNNGIGVWKVQAAAEGPVHPWSVIRVQEAHPPTAAVTDITLADFVDRLGPAFALGPVIDQEFQDTLDRGMIRVYFAGPELVGFCHQQPRGLVEPRAAAAGSPPSFLMQPADAPDYAQLRHELETVWLPQVTALLGIPNSRLPAIWDADFLHRAGTPEPHRRFVLSEINTSAVWPFPEWACARIARMTHERVMSPERAVTT